MPLPSSPEESNLAKDRQPLSVKALALQMLIALAVALSLSTLKLDYFEAYLYDIRVRLTPSAAHSQNIELILIEPETIEKFRGVPSVLELKKLLEKISLDGARFIALDDDLLSFPGSLKDKRLFADWSIQAPGFFVLVNQLEMKGQEGSLSLPPPFDAVPLYPAPKTSDLKIFAKDGVTRRMLISYQDQLMFHTYVAGSYNNQVKFLENIRGTFSFAGSEQAYIQFRRAGSYPRLSFEQVASGSFQPGRFKDKVVIIGSDTAITSQDYISTPYSRDIQAMTTVEMHANMIDTLIFNKAPRATPQWLNVLFVFLISVLTIHVVLSVKPLKGLGILLLTLILFSVFSYSLLAFIGVWIKMAQPILAIFLVYYFFIPYRLIVESRRSWEYYQKHKLLSQVEELKTNFISMMSHDLKTPIARIQGMADMILRDPMPLSSGQRESVDTIKASADDLLKFINAILAYGRIESEGVQLHLESKDINKLITEVVRKHEFLAKLKKIQILTELEPLFPIQLDPELIKQVLSNLVENAIKYSPEDTKILITSEERLGKILIQVTDQGPGIPSDELQNIFMKFFRSKNHKSSPIKGSGLGLYLAKYFTELHRGSIFVESSHGKGSTFTVELPLDLGGQDA